METIERTTSEEIKPKEEKEMLSVAFSDDKKTPVVSSENREIETEKTEEENMTKDNDKHESELNTPPAVMPSQEDGGKAE